MHHGRRWYWSVVYPRGKVGDHRDFRIGLACTDLFIFILKISFISKIRPRKFDLQNKIKEKSLCL